MNFPYDILRRLGNLSGKSRLRAALRASCWVSATAALGILLMTSGTAQAALLAYEGFDYGAGTSALAGSGSASDPGWAGSWNAVTNTADVSPGSLVYSDVVYSGNRASVPASRNCRTNRFVDTSTGGTFDLAGLVEGNRIGADGQTLYVSFLQRISMVPGSQSGQPDYLRYYTVEFATGNGNNDRALLIGHDDVAPFPHYVARTPSNESGSAISAPLETQDTEVNFFVLKFTFGAGDDDRVDIYRNPSLLLEPATPTATLGGLGLGYDFSFDRIAITRFVGNNPVHDADEIRFGTTFADVAPVPEPSTAILLVSAGVCVFLSGAGRRMRRRAARG